MRLYVDSAEPARIEQALRTGYVWGVTTNPTLLRRAGVRRSELSGLITRAVGLGAHEVHVQVLTPTVEAMMDEARALLGVDPDHVVVKVPATAAGLAAAVRLARDGVPITATAVFTVRQAVLAGTEGARYAAVYLDRIRSRGHDAVALIGRMREAIRAHGLSLRLLVASVRTADDVEMLAGLGVEAVTLPPDLLSTLFDVEDTLEAARRFQEDAEHL